MTSQDAFSASWEKIYVKKSTDCFRSVREVPGGGYVLAGYTANFAPSDTDGLVVRMDTNGDTMWTFVYNGPSSKEDCFYKVVPTDDNGFILCGYSRSFGSGENAFYLKLNSSGDFQWVKNWGGSGIERAQDIVELSDGSFVICGYTTSPPARYYDAFILKVSQNGNTIWSKIYGTSAYDDANSLKELPDDGFILGGQSNNQIYLIRTNSDGDSLWTKSFGTTGTENVESVNFSQQGDGFILAGTTTGAGAGGEDGYLVRTDTGGVQIWAKTFGGSDNDGFHRIEKTSDGGYVGSGTSSKAVWFNPNYWLVKFDGSGNLTWEKFFGGDSHDHGYSGQQTSDGGYIIAGHTHSFASDKYEEDAYVVKTGSSGTVANELTWTTVTQLLSPLGSNCGVDNAQIKVEVANYGKQTVTSIPVTVKITGAINQTISQTLSTTVTPGSLKTLTFTTTIDMSMGGTFKFHCYTGNPLDVISGNNYLDKSITVEVTSDPPSVSNGSHCGPGVVSLSASSPDILKWYSAASGGSSLFTGDEFTTPYITSTTTYYAQAGQNCPSTRVPVNATITAGLTPPSKTDGDRCGPGTVTLSGSSAYPIKWYSNSTSTSVLYTGSTYVTPTINSSANYYIAAENATCSSNRVQVQAIINSFADEPAIVPGNNCGSGTVVLSASASDPLKWYTSATGGSSVGSGSTYTTPIISTTTTFYVQADDGLCPSNRVAIVATIDPIPLNPITFSGENCGEGKVVLTATAAVPIKWFDAAIGGTQVGSGNSFTSPVISSTTIYYALADNGPCRSNRISAIATIHPLPADPVTSSVERCGEGTVTLTATAGDPVSWFDDPSGGNLVGTGNNFTTPVISTTTIYYAMTDNGQCEGNKIPATAVVNPLPVVDIGLDSIYTLTSPYVLDAGAGFTSYTWSPSGTSQTDTIYLTGKYCVTVTDAKNCIASDCSYVEFIVGIENNFAKSGLHVYPNPSNGIITIELPEFFSKADFSVMNITSQKVLIETLNQHKETIDLSFLSPGIYFIQINNSQTSTVNKLVIK